jgi:hypothetical protein
LGSAIDYQIEYNRYATTKTRTPIKISFTVLFEKKLAPAEDLGDVDCFSFDSVVVSMIEDMVIHAP